MNHPHIASVYGYQSYLKLLDEAENYRRVKALRKSKSKTLFFVRIKQSLSSLWNASHPVDTPALQN